MKNNNSESSKNHNIEIDKEENILWEGKPIKNIYINKNWKYYLGCAFWGIIVVSFETMIIYYTITGENNTGWGMPIYGGFLVSIVLYLLFGHHWLMGKFWNNEYYILTDKNVYVQKGFKSTYIRKIPLEYIESIETEYKSGKYNNPATLHLLLNGMVASHWGLYQRFKRRKIGGIEAPRLLALENADNINNMIINAKKELIVI